MTLKDIPKENTTKGNKETNDDGRGRGPRHSVGLLQHETHDDGEGSCCCCFLREESEKRRGRSDWRLEARQYTTGYGSTWVEGKMEKTVKETQLCTDRGMMILM